MIKDRPLCAVCLALFLITAASVHWGGAHLIRELKSSPLEQKAVSGDKAAIVGQVYKTEERQTFQILYLKDISIQLHQHSLKESRILIYDDSKTPTQIGNIIYAGGEVSFFDSARNPGNFDQKLYYRKQDIHARIWADTVTVKGKKVYRIRNELNEFRRMWKRVLLDVMGKQKGGALSAMLLGDKADMDQDLKELYQVNGIGHILAISGLHLSFIGLGIYRVIRRTTGSFSIAGICGILFLLCYILMIGFTVSAVRALVMFLFRVGADILGRNYDAPTALAVAAAVVIIWRPLSIYDGGFWLSFGAVLGILAVLPIFEGLPLGAIWAGISINLTILPIILYYFYEFPLYSILLNLIVIPFMSLLLLLGMAGSLIFLLLPGAGRVLLTVCGGILGLYEQSCNLTLMFPASRIVTGQPKLWQIAIYYILLVACILLLRRDKAVVRRQKDTLIRGRLAASVVLMLLGAVVFIVLPKWSQSGSLEITVLDVGQGDCIFIRGESGLSCLVDGGSSDIKNVGKYRIEPYLKYQGVKTLDYVFVSHGDSDHMNGIEEMITRQKTGVQIKTLVLPVHKVWDESLDALALKAAEKGIRVMSAEPGNILKAEGLVITCLQPGENYEGENGNAASMVLAVRYGEFDMLLTGDVEGDGEDELTEYIGKDYKHTWEVLKAAHHGSKNSSKEEFLTELAPMYTIISAGVDNRYGHPHPETLKRLEDTGSTIYSTREQGAVSIKVKDSRLTVFTPAAPAGTGDKRP